MSRRIGLLTVTNAKQFNFVAAGHKDVDGVGRGAELEAGSKCKGRLHFGTLSNADLDTATSIVEFMLAAKQFLLVQLSHIAHYNIAHYNNVNECFPDSFLDLCSSEQRSDGTEMA